MATSFFFIYVMAPSFFYFYAMATSFFYIYIDIYKLTERPVVLFLFREQESRDARPAPQKLKKPAGWGQSWM